MQSLASSGRLKMEPAPVLHVHIPKTAGTLGAKNERSSFQTWALLDGQEGWDRTCEISYLFLDECSNSLFSVLVFWTFMSPTETMLTNLNK